MNQGKANYKLEPKAISLLQEVESLLNIQVKKINTEVLGSKYENNIQKYLELFPKIKLPSGKSARSDKRNIEIAFKWFFENHSYSWDTIFKATGDYIDEYERKTPAYLYMMTSQYFIRKQQSDKSWQSELANQCSIIESGGLDENNAKFSDKVV